MPHGGTMDISGTFSVMAYVWVQVVHFEVTPGRWLRQSRKHRKMNQRPIRDQIVSVDLKGTGALCTPSQIPCKLCIFGSFEELIRRVYCMTHYVALQLLWWYFSSFFLPFSFLLGGEGRFVGMENDEWDWAARSGRHKNKQTKRKWKKKNSLFGRVVQKILWHTSCQWPFRAVFLQIPTFQVSCPTSNQTLHCIVSSWELT